MWIFQRFFLPHFHSLPSLSRGSCWLLLKALAAHQHIQAFRHTHTLSLSHNPTQTHTHTISFKPNRRRNYKVRAKQWKMAEWKEDVDWSRQNKLNRNHLPYWRSAFNYPLMRQRQRDGLDERVGKREEEQEGEKGWWWWRGERAREWNCEEVGVGGGFFLVAITIQSGRNVCGTKWSVMGNRLLQLNTEGERRQQRVTKKGWMDGLDMYINTHVFGILLKMWNTCDKDTYVM